MKRITATVLSIILLILFLTSCKSDDNVNNTVSSTSRTTVVSIDEYIINQSKEIKEGKIADISYKNLQFYYKDIDWYITSDQFLKKTKLKNYTTERYQDVNDKNFRFVQKNKYIKDFDAKAQIEYSMMYDSRFNIRENVFYGVTFLLSFEKYSEQDEKFKEIVQKFKNEFGNPTLGDSTWEGRNGYDYSTLSIMKAGKIIRIQVSSHPERDYKK